MKLDVTLTWAAHLTVSDGVIRYFYREFYIQEAQKVLTALLVLMILLYKSMRLHVNLKLFWRALIVAILAYLLLR